MSWQTCDSIRLNSHIRYISSGKSGEIFNELPIEKKIRRPLNTQIAQFKLQLFSRRIDMNNFSSAGPQIRLDLSGSGKYKLKVEFQLH